MNDTKRSVAVVKAYFSAFQKGDMKKVLGSFHQDCLIVSVREEEREREQLHGTYRTKEEAKQFIENLKNRFSTREFTVETVIGEGAIVFANGKFAHEVKATGKLFLSDWAQRCIIKDDKILEYRFYEDSAAFVYASQVSINYKKYFKI